MTKHLQKFTAVLLAVIMTLGVFAVVPFTASAETSGDFEYWVLDDGTAAIKGYTGTDTELTIPSEIDGYKVTIISDYAFDDCTRLTSITVNNSITIIGDDAFDDCTRLTSITVNNSNANYSSVDGVLFNKNKTELLRYPEGKSDENYIIPNSVSSIWWYAFYYCENLISITIPDSVTSIGKGAFSYCENLKSITIPDSVTSIGGDAFRGTTWFYNQPDGLVYAGKVAYSYIGKMPKNTSLTIKDGTKSIADKAFLGCTGLTSITIPDSVTSIGVDSFNKCTNLKSITIPNSMTSIGEWTFRECTGLTSITIPDSVTSINERAFDGCTRLTSITVNNSNANYSSVDGVLFNKNKTELIKYLEGKTDENYTIPDSVTSIGKWAFASCRRIKSLTIPTSVTSIGEWAFNNCGINSITIPASVTSIYGTDLGFFDGVILVDTLTITGYKGTAAEKYANEYGFKFIALDDSANPTDPTNPTNPTVPTVPSNPTEPTEPTNPTVPTEPTDPTNPIQPTEPNNPDDPANPNPDNTSKPSLGDIDGDGKISVNDVTDIQKYIVQLKPFTDEQMKFADVDKNGKIDVNDVTLLQKVIVKIAVI